MKLTIGTRIWSEDEATTNDPDHEDRHDAWQRITGTAFDHSTSIVTIDNGDSTEFYCRVGDRIFLLVGSWPGEASIFEVTEEA